MRLQEDVAAKVRFNADGLVPAVAQDAASGQVLMLAWMDDAEQRACHLLVPEPSDLLGQGGDLGACAARGLRAPGLRW